MLIRKPDLNKAYVSEKPGRNAIYIPMSKKKMLTLQSEHFLVKTSDEPLKPSSASKSNIPLLSKKIPYENGFIEHHSDGLFFVVYDKSHNVNSKQLICSTIKVIARGKDIYNESWSLIVEWPDRDQQIHQHSISYETLHSDSREYRKVLAAGGLVITTDKRLQRALDIFFNYHPIEKILIGTSKTGWLNGCFVLPNQIFGKNKHHIYYQSQNKYQSLYVQKGTHEEWKSELCSFLGSQSRLAFSISVALAGPLLEILGLAGGGFHLFGSSSIGKTTTLIAATSVYSSSKNYIKSWNTTKNALEGLASMHNNVFLPLDEISLASRKEIGEISYMLANSQGKSRSTTNGHNMETKIWNILFLSTGEETVESILKQVGTKNNVGIQVRLCNIEADAGKGLGIFDSLELGNTAEEQAEIIHILANKFYGTAGVTWLEYITKNKDKVLEDIQYLIDKFMDDYRHVNGQAHRVAYRFAVVSAAGELATKIGITGWKPNQSVQASKTCLNNWLSNHGCSNEYSEIRSLQHLVGFLEKYSHSRFEKVGQKKRVNTKYGYYRATDDLYLFAPNSFREVCLPYDKDMVVNALKKRNLISFNEAKRGTLKINNKSIEYGRAYAVKGAIMKYDLGL